MAAAPAVEGDNGCARGGLVCVTGGSGFIGSWLVRLLLDRGYTVHATVKNLQDEGETKHLQALDGADTRLRLFQMDLLDPASIRPAVEGAHGVFHLASPLILQPAQDPENELLQPAVEGTRNVLRAAKDCGVSRVVLVSSQTAMVPNPDWPADKVIDDDSWADVEILKKLELWYNVSKTLAEKAAWDFAGEEGLPLVVLNPSLVLGPTLTPAATPSQRLLMQLLGGQKLDMEPYYIGCVDVRDVAQSLLVLYENPSAQGRHLCLESTERLVDFIDKLANLYPEFPLHRIKEDKQVWVVRSKVGSQKLIDLGVRFTPFEKTVRDTVDCLRSKGLI
ncbi:phenylacetaldehyde reductase-like [Lolium rigidum]|uniref:phenylacetaldehyde reductase-like n=1 Tax=Lolium rigidum TaxID=89674 RepID=UPI001F5CE02C|nr:phenylacetaldehyde reductase-like [Lolium rigidum]